MWNPLAKLFPKLNRGPTAPERTPPPQRAPSPQLMGPLPTSLGPRLSDEERLKVVELLAQFQTPTAVQRYVATQFKKAVNISSIERYRSSPQWAPLFVRARQEYLARISDVAVANKRVRLERLEGLYVEAMTDPALEKHGSKRRSELRSTLREARNEMEGPKAGDVNISVTNISTLTTEELERRRRELVLEIQPTPEEESHAVRET